MNITLERESLLRPLQAVGSVVERRQTLPILSNILFSIDGGKLTLTGTDLEVEMVAQLPVETPDSGDITLPAKKFIDICRALPENARLDLKLEQDKAIIRSGRSRFTLATMPAAEFPNIDPIESPLEFSISQQQLKKLIEQTQFSMAQQDVRYYLNGLMLELSQNVLRAVATDGHRLAVCEVDAELPITEPRQVILPRKGVTELMRLLEESETTARIQLGENHIRVELPDISFTSKLIDGKFPDYQQVIPKDPARIVTCERQPLYEALHRAAVLSNEKYRGMRLTLSANQLKATVHNPEQEEAEEELEVSYDGDEFEIGFNVSYFLDALSALKSDQVTIGMIDANHSCLIQGNEDHNSRYVIMPMRL
ncbi:DNA polymerase III subunit beta [Thiohalophilus thiocyanatoxydans]|uniref:Beta sliding clamp n=1 Tax=Thiohalophilus thiocyanatoxydans TaxID=381308 RepID=A0A4V3H4N5_9GAMM|nr:DNA polymerase III subunit beta [Thiohalophilus thiocyanatoxydans]TDY03865.1 DNA polymerase III beta subunit [Thiohalophilus thiocyanatoxydans]